VRDVAGGRRGRGVVAVRDRGGCSVRALARLEAGLAMEIDTFNKFGVGVRGDDIAFLQPVPRQLTRADALLLAAWIVALIGDQRHEGEQTFEDVLTAVENT
jgi:hypothetical protein